MSSSGGKRPIRAYVDIETTGLNRYQYELTVVGVCLEHGRSRRVVQFYDSTLTRKNILDALADADVLYTFNGERFDLPFIRHHLGLNLAKHLEHCDLTYRCWDRGLWGGQKKVEYRLGISRKTAVLTEPMPLTCGLSAKKTAASACSKSP